MIVTVCKHIKPQGIRSTSLLFNQNVQRNMSTSPASQFTTNQQQSKKLKRSEHYFNDYHLIKNVHSETGAIYGVPTWYKFGIVKLLVTFSAFLLVGAQISKSFVRFLEENDIFKPEDDEDDEEGDN